ncbi:MAG: hypothetical protein WC470_03405 [Candidatus Paceibacterota bacterium]
MQEISLKIKNTNLKVLKGLKIDLEKIEGLPSELDRNMRCLLVHTSINGKGFMNIPRSLCDDSIKHDDFLRLKEKGGGDYHAGQIICGVKGEILEPLYWTRNEATFLAKEAVQINAVKDDGKLSIKIQQIKLFPEKGKLCIKENTIFEGLCDEKWFEDRFSENTNQMELAIPWPILLFYFPVREAVRKSRCDNCHRLHYADTSNKVQRADMACQAQKVHYPGQIRPRCYS